MATFAHILGDWSKNIGNAFFQLGGLYVLNRCSDKAGIAIISEQPGYPSYWNPRGGNPRNNFEMASFLNVDYLVLMGPIFRPEIEKIWGDTLSKILANGTRLIYLGIGAMNYDSDNLKEYRAFLKKYKPYIFTSRDTKTFEAMGDIAEHAYDGIDFGFFVPEIYTPEGRWGENYKVVALNFDKLPEPTIKVGKTIGSANKTHTIFDKAFSYGGDLWTVHFSPIRLKFSSRSRYGMFIEGLIFPGSDTMEIGNFTVVRTDHRPHPLIKRKTFRSPNVLVNDTPYPYLEVYRKADLTLSNRIHACVAALSYGRRAMLFSKSPRIDLLSRLGLDEITNKPVEIDADLLQLEKVKLLSFLSQHIR